MRSSRQQAVCIYKTQPWSLYLQGSYIYEKYPNRVHNPRVYKYFENRYSRICEYVAVSCEDRTNYRLNISGNIKISTKIFVVKVLLENIIFLPKFIFAKIRAVSSSPYIFWSLSFISAWCAVLLFTHAQHLVTLTHPRSEPDPNIEHGDADTLC